MSNETKVLTNDIKAPCDTRSVVTQELAADPQAGQLPNCVLCVVVVPSTDFSNANHPNPADLTTGDECIKEMPVAGISRTTPSGRIEDRQQAVLQVNCKLTRWLGWVNVHTDYGFMPNCDNVVATDDVPAPNQTQLIRPAGSTVAEDKTDIVAGKKVHILGTYGSNRLFMCQNAYNAGLLSDFVMHAAAASKTAAAAIASSSASAATAATSSTSAGGSTSPTALLPSQ